MEIFTSSFFDFVENSIPDLQIVEEISTNFNIASIPLNSTEKFLSEKDKLLLLKKKFVLKNLKLP